MSVLSSNEILPRRSTFDESFTTTHIRTFRVETDNVNNDGYTVAVLGALASPDPVPLRYAVHPTDPSCLCTRLEPNQDNSDAQRTWTVTATYTNKADSDQNDENPVDRAPKIGGRGNRAQEPCEQDRNGKAIMNTAKQSFDPPVVKDDTRAVLTVSRFEIAPPYSMANDYRDAINSDAFQGATTGTVKLQDIVFQRHVENDTVYYECNYEFEYRRQGWRKKILNRGTLYRLAATTDNLSLDQHGSVVNMTSDSVKIAYGSTVGIHYVSADVYEAKDFSLLGIVI